MKARAAAADGLAPSPVKGAGPLFQLAPSPPQQKLHAAKRTQDAAPRAAGRQQPRSLFPDAADAGRSDAMQPAPSAAGSAAADSAATLPAATGADPMAMWDTRTHEGAQQCSQSVTEQPPAEQCGIGQPASDCVIDLEDERWSDRGQRGDSEAAAALSAEQQSLTELLDTDPPGLAAVPASGPRQRDAGAATAAQPAAADAWMPSSMDQVRDFGDCRYQPLVVAVCSFC